MSIVNAAAATTYHFPQNLAPAVTLNPPATPPASGNWFSQAIQEAADMLARVTRTDVAVFGDLMINGRHNAALSDAAGRPR